MLALIALAAKVNAATGEDPIAAAIRYADALSGGSERHRAPVLDAEEDDDADEDADAALEEAEEAEEIDGGGAADAGEADEAAEAGDAADAGETAEEIEADRRAEIEPLDASDGSGDGDDDAMASDGGEAAGVAGADGSADPGSDPGGGALAMLDSELDPGDDLAGRDAADAAAPAGAAEQYEASLRHRRPSRWGRLDVGMSWRRRWTEPMHAPANRYDELWLVATWRR